MLVSAPQLVKKYWHVLNIGIQNNLTYRVSFLFRIVFGFIPLLATIFLWRAIYAGKGGANVGDYTLVQMTSYYLIVTLVDVLTAVSEDDWQIAADIKDGNISQFLVKPINYLTYRLFLFFSGRMIYLLVSAVPLGILMLAGLVWYLLACANIWRCALDAGVGMGMVVSVGYFLMSILEQQLLPDK